MRLRFATYLAVVLCAVTGAPQSSRASVISNRLKNAGFESGVGTSNTDWRAFGAAFRDSTQARSGSYSTKVYGQFYGGLNYSGVYQDVPATNGQAWEGSAWLENWSGDAMQGTNYACVRVDFYDASGASVWAVSSLEQLTTGTPQNTWTKYTVRSIAPRGTVTARFVMLFVQQPTYEAGSAWFDDCEFGLSTQTNAAQFAGLAWSVTEGLAYPGYPGPNLFATNSAYIDTNGWLHLRLTPVGSKWYCAQVSSIDTFGYGEYTWKLPGRVDLLNSNLVLGLFTYEPTKNGVWNEMDFEITRAFDGMAESNLQFAIQPAYLVAGNSLRTPMNLSSNGTTHRFLWEPGETRFVSYRGLGDTPASTNEILAQWIYAGTNQPVHSNEVAFMNLYLWITNAPAVTQELDLAISDFTFTPFRGSMISDNFDDNVRSNVWALNGFEGGGSPLIDETNGLLGVQPTGDWLTAGYITTNPVNWNNRDAWTVFSARLTTIRVDTAVAGADARAVIELVSEPPNMWMATNGIALYAIYDRDSNTVTFSLQSKTNRPVADGDERFRATLANAGSYMTPTGGIDIRLGMGRNQYRLELCNRQGAGLPVVTNSGAATASHLCGETLNHGYWLVGAMNEGTGRGKAFWDRADAVAEMPTVSWGSGLRYSGGYATLLNVTNKRVSFRLVADQNEAIDKVYLCAAKRGATLTWRMDVQTNDTAGRPAGAVLASQTFSVSSTNLSWVEVDMTNFSWIKGQAYHLAVSLASGAINATNYAVFPSEMTNTAGRGVMVSTGAVPSWVSAGAVEPAFRVLYANGTSYAQPYVTNSIVSLSGTNRIGQRFTADGSITVSNITILLARSSTAADAQMDLRQAADKVLMSTSRVASAQLATTNKWITFAMSPPARLYTGVPYYFEVRRASGSGTLTVTPQDTVSAGDYSWGGTNSCCIYSGNSGTTWVDRAQMDIGFFVNGP